MVGRDEGHDFKGNADDPIEEAMLVFDRGLQDNAMGGEVVNGSIWSILSGWIAHIHMRFVVCAIMYFLFLY